METGFICIPEVCRLSRQHKLYNKELYADFIAAQIKTLSFLAYIIRIYQVASCLALPLPSVQAALTLVSFPSPPPQNQDLVSKYSQQMVKGMLQLLSNCPSETAHLRKELLIAAKHILTTDLRSRTSVRPLPRRRLAVSTLPL